MGKSTTRLAVAARSDLCSILFGTGGAGVLGNGGAEFGGGGGGAAVVGGGGADMVGIGGAVVVGDVGSMPALAIRSSAAFKRASSSSSSRLWVLTACFLASSQFNKTKLCHKKTYFSSTDWFKPDSSPPRLKTPSRASEKSKAIVLYHAQPCFEYICSLAYDSGLEPRMRSPPVLVSPRCVRARGIGVEFESVMIKFADCL